MVKTLQGTGPRLAVNFPVMAPLTNYFSCDQVFTHAKVRCEHNVEYECIGVYPHYNRLRCALCEGHSLWSSVGIYQAKPPCLRSFKTTARHVISNRCGHDRYPELTYEDARTLPRSFALPFSFLGPNEHNRTTVALDYHGRPPSWQGLLIGPRVVDLILFMFESCCPFDHYFRSTT
eukprot:1188950-Prorocentrum_minimum.AAC.2